MIHFIPLDKIEISPSRQRKEFKEVDLQELVSSIRDTAHGLLQPLVLRQGLAGGFVLVAGERRLRAIRDIYELGGTFLHNDEMVRPGFVPYVTLGELSQLEAWEAELEENIRRVDLTWQERAAATASLMDLRRAQAEDAGTAPPTVGDVARELRPEQTREAAHDATRKELIVSRFLHDPEVRGASTVQEAFKVLKKKEEGQRNRELAARIGATFTTSRHTMLNLDSIDWMAQTAERFDIILTDPPYGMGADAFDDSGKGVASAAHFYDDSQDSWRALIEQFAVQSWRVTKPDAHLYAFCDIGNFTEFRCLLQLAGWTVHRTPLVWHNPNGFRAPWPEKGPQRKYELILYAVRGEKRCTALRGDVLEYRKDTATGHPAQKPVNLLIDLLKRSARPEDLVLDPFAGSGSTLVACDELKLACTAIELDPGAYGIAAHRLQRLNNEPELPL